MKDQTLCFRVPSDKTVVRNSAAAVKDADRDSGFQLLYLLRLLTLRSFTVTL